MSERALRRLLSIAGFFVVPFPIVALGPGRVPAAHQLELGLLSLAFGALESAQGVTLTLAAAFLIPTATYAVVLWSGAWLLARVLAKLPPFPRTRLALLLIGIGVAIGIAEPVYRTPFSARSAHSNLLDVYR